MAEVTKKKLASIYSLIVGFFLTVFSGHAHAGEFFKSSRLTPKKTTTGEATTASPTIYRTTPNVAPTVEAIDTMAPTTDLNEATEPMVMIKPTTERVGAPAPTTSYDIAPTVERVGAPAPDALTVTGAVTSVSEIENKEVQAFIIETAGRQNKSLDALTEKDIQTYTNQYLLRQIDLLEKEIQLLREQNLSN